MNFPTRKLQVWIYDNYNGNTTFDIAADWNPAREVEIELIIPNSAYRNSTNATVFKWCGQTMATRTATAGYRIWGVYTPESRIWTTFNQQANTQTYSVPLDGSSATTGPGLLATNAPATVEEWLSFHPEWVTP